MHSCFLLCGCLCTILFRHISFWLDSLSWSLGCSNDIHKNRQNQKCMRDHLEEEILESMIIWLVMVLTWPFEWILRYSILAQSWDEKWFRCSPFWRWRFLAAMSGRCVLLLTSWGKEISLALVIVMALWALSRKESSQFVFVMDAFFAFMAAALMSDHVESCDVISAWCSTICSSCFTSSIVLIEKSSWRITLVYKDLKFEASPVCSPLWISVSEHITVLLSVCSKIINHGESHEYIMTSRLRQMRTILPYGLRFLNWSLDFCLRAILPVASKKNWTENLK